MEEMKRYHFIIPKGFSLYKNSSIIYQTHVFNEIVKNKVKLRENIYLKMAYGTDQIANSLFEWIGSENEKVLNAISTIVNLVSDWDDLWIAYAIASLELEVVSFTRQSNIKLLNEKYDQIGIDFNYTSYQDLIDSIDSIVQKIIPLWTEDSIPVKTPADQRQYIRDLLFLKAYYEKR